MICVFQKKHGWIFYVGVPFLLFLVYVALCVVLQLQIKDSVVIPMGIGDGLVAIVLGIWYYIVFTKRDRLYADLVPFRFDKVWLFGFAVLFLVLLFGSQAMGTWIRNVAVTGGDSYSTMSNRDLFWYMILASTLGPIAEELLYRGFMYRWLRERFGMLFSLIYATVLFTLSHGTLYHIPLCVGLSLFITIIYEMTGKLWHCMLIHILSNVISMAFVITIPVTYQIGLMIAFGIAVMISLVLLAGLDVVKQRCQYDASRPTLVSWLEEDRKHWGETHEKRNEGEEQ